MSSERLHRFRRDGRRFAVDVNTCFCFECDDITWDLLEFYPQESSNRIYRLLESRHDRGELAEVVGELEWLRATQSILPEAKQSDQAKLIEIERGLKRLSVDLRGDGSEALREQALALLLGRSLKQTALELELVIDADYDDEKALAAWGDAVASAASLSGKTISVVVLIEELPLRKEKGPLAGHRLDARVGYSPEFQLPGSKARTPAQWSKAYPGATAVLRPTGHAFVDAVTQLREAGFTSIALDVDRLFLSGAVDVNAIFAEYERLAAYYAQRLLARDYFRLEPLADLFRRIHQGKAISRGDESGTYAMVVTRDGVLYPSWDFAANEAHVLGSLSRGTFDDAAYRTFDDVGASTTAACLSCWARNVCGGGSAAVHEVLGGSIVQPEPSWCEQQRSWLEASVAAFNDLASSGVPFDRVYAQLDHRAKPSLFTMAKAAFRMSVGVRPLAEADAELLRLWENWNRSAYFLMSERSVFIGNAYERELDATHPRPGEQELMVIQKDGSPLGLLKLRPGASSGLGEAFVYFRDPASYRSSGIASSLKSLMREAVGEQGIRRIVAPAAPWEEDLGEFLVACGFVPAGTWREALFTKGSYHDVSVFSAEMASL